MNKLFTVVAAMFAAVPVWAEAQAAAPGGAAGGLLGMAPWLAIFAIFYFLLIRPQQKQAKEQKKMIDEIKRGDRILTSGGLYGTVTAVKGKVLEIKIADEVKVLLSRQAVSQVVSEDPAKEPESAIVTPAK